MSAQLYLLGKGADSSWKGFCTAEPEGVKYVSNPATFQGFQSKFVQRLQRLKHIQLL
jgi:hypothetical protein